MHIEDLRQIHDTYDHIYLSPHLNDAALSCGGAIARHTANGARVLIVTICTGIPAAEGGFSAFAESLHRKWALTPENAVVSRLLEDIRATEKLGADSFWFGKLDAIYRRPDVYNSEETLFGPPTPNDHLVTMVAQLLGALRARAPHATFYAPLGVGMHVDHQQVCKAALVNHPSLTAAFYEDIPYVTTPGALEQRLAALGGAFVASTIDIDETIERKVKAIAAYTSQLKQLFGGAEGMRRTVTRYAAGLQVSSGVYAERLWLRAAPDVSNTWEAGVRSQGSGVRSSQGLQ
jgi:LmbE family N-acetylglucosaminyl deacetylase